MTILSIIAEYNPFHNGHGYHLAKSIEKSQADYVIAIMSGSFVQRGEPSIIDKWSKAKIAIDNGIDLVIELPTAYACQRAESFASGAIKLIDRLGVVDYISFGAESHDLDLLDSIAKSLVEKPQAYRRALEEFIGASLSFPRARARALSLYLKNPAIEDIMNNSNNILAIEYLKSLREENSTIKPLLIKRQGPAYAATDIKDNYLSATGIRSQAFEGRLDGLEDFLPKESLSSLKDYNQVHGLNSIYNYEAQLLYLLRTESFNKKIFDATEDLINRIINNSHQYNRLEDIIRESVSKTYTVSRVKRTLLNILLGYTEEMNSELSSMGPSYIRVLASNQKGLRILNKIKQESQLPIINKFSHYHKLKNPGLNRLIGLDKLATDLFFLASKKSPYNMDYKVSPYIKKEEAP